MLEAVTLPKFYSYNMKRLILKIESPAKDFDDRMCDLSFSSEIWGRDENRRHIYKIEELFDDMHVTLAIHV